MDAELREAIEMYIEGLIDCGELANKVVTIYAAIKYQEATN